MLPQPIPNEVNDRHRSRLIAGLLFLVLAFLGYRAYVPSLATRPLESTHQRQVDLNKAERAELVQLPGVGPNLADAILAHREKSGRFASVEDLSHVHGIGSKTLDKLRPWVSVGNDVVSLPPVDQLEKLTREPMNKGTVTRSAKITASEPRINVNTAAVEELMRLPGIGTAMATRIVETRDQKRFEKVEDLRRVRGIGPKILEGLKPFVTLE